MTPAAASGNGSGGAVYAQAELETSLSSADQEVVVVPIAGTATCASWHKQLVPAAADAVVVPIAIA